MHACFVRPFWVRYRHSGRRNSIITPLQKTPLPVKFSLSSSPRAVSLEPGTRVPRVIQMLAHAPSRSYGFFNPRLNPILLRDRCISSICLATLTGRSTPDTVETIATIFCWNRPPFALRLLWRVLAGRIRPRSVSCCPVG